MLYCVRLYYAIAYYITLHYITLPYLTLPYLTLHYMCVIDIGSVINITILTGATLHTLPALPEDPRGHESLGADREEAYSILYYTALYYTILHYIILYYTILWYRLV